MRDNSLATIEYFKVNTEAARATERVVRETGLVIYINKRHFTTAMIMPTMEKEFVTGYLFGQGFINSVSEIESITIKNNITEISLPEKKEKKRNPPAIHSKLKVRREEIFNTVKAILKSEIFAETEAVHSAGLFLNGEKPIAITEDLGRHHALDKVLGAALLEQTDFSRILAASTGRQPTEMITKCLNAGIPIMATKGGS